MLKAAFLLTAVSLSVFAAPCEKTLLLTGATGFVGRNFLLKTLETKQYAKIVVPVRNPGKLVEQLKVDGIHEVPDSLQIIESCAPRWEMESIDVQHVVHCAATTFARTRAEYRSVNVEGAMAIIDQVQGAERIVVVSSLAAVGPTPPGRHALIDGAPPNPVSWYGESKLEMERQLSQRPHPGMWVLRPPMVLGPRDSASRPLFSMARSPLRIKAGLKPKFYSFVSVRDLVSAIEATLTNEALPGENPFYFVGHQQVFTDLELLAEASKAVNRRRGLNIRIPDSSLNRWSYVTGYLPGVRHLPQLSRGRIGDTLAPRLVIDSTRFEQTVGWTAQQDLQSTIQETHEWIRAADGAGSR